MYFSYLQTVVQPVKMEEHTSSHLPMLTVAVPVGTQTTTRTEVAIMYICMYCMHYSFNKATELLVLLVHSFVKHNTSCFPIVCHLP